MTTATIPPENVAVGMIARLRKAHPCGGFDWQVTRIGADIGLRCRTCDRRVLLPREEFERRLRTLRIDEEGSADEPA